MMLKKEERHLMAELFERLSAVESSEFTRNDVQNLANKYIWNLCSLLLLDLCKTLHKELSTQKQEAAERVQGLDLRHVHNNRTFGYADLNTNNAFYNRLGWIFLFTLLINRVKCVLLRETVCSLLIPGSHSPEIRRICLLPMIKHQLISEVIFRKCQISLGRSPAEAMETFWTAKKKKKSYHLLYYPAWHFYEQGLL